MHRVMNKCRIVKHHRLIAVKSLRIKTLHAFLPVECFDNFMQQDAHEFLNYLLNTIAETVEGMFYLLYSHSVTISRGYDMLPLNVAYRCLNHIRYRK